MKKYIILLLTCLSATVYAQDPGDRQDYKFIEVTGSAEMEVIPDEIYLGISLMEFEKDKKKVSLEELERRLIRVLNSFKLDVKNLEVDNVHGHMYRKKRKPEEFFATKRYILKLKDLNMIDTLIYALDEIGVNQVNIDRTEYSKLEELKIKIKTQALIAARAKAQALMGAIGENIGKAILVREINVYEGPVYKNYMANARMVSDEAEAQPEINFRKMKIRYEMQARFELK